jgi:PAS domain S-box-containing protein
MFTLTASMTPEALVFGQNIFDTSGFPARWQCGTGWTDFQGWLYIFSDLLVWSAYFAIPLIIVRYLIKKKDARFHWGYILFAGFILSCGTSHLLDALIFWVPVYRLNAYVLLITGILSWITVFYLFKVAPIAFSMKTAAELEAEVESRKLIEETLKIKLHQMNEAQSIAKMGSWEWDVKLDQIIWSDELYRIFEYDKDNKLNFEIYLSLIHPEDREYVQQTLLNAFANKQYQDFYHRVLTPTGNVKILHGRGNFIFDEEGNVAKMIGTGQDVTEQKTAEKDLLQKTIHLEKANTELQQFAYVASHDLQEPLRKIRTYVSLLESENINLQVDVRSKGHVEKINSSAIRMQHLMQDILDFSRLSNENFAYTETDLNEVLQTVLAELEIPIITSSAEIQYERLPVIEARESQWVQLFQNLLSNALKFHRPNENPQITINVTELTGAELDQSPIRNQYKFKDWDDKYYWTKEKFCQIKISDKGIGFDDQYKERIFVPFERLHNYAHYKGTGIGLAICKKIVEGHHGSIHAESLTEGTVFTIIVPISQDHFLG